MPPSTKLKGLGDPSHPNFGLSRDNAQTHLMKLPKELRLEIYGYLLAEDHNVEPIQMQRRSNQFMDQAKVNYNQATHGPQPPSDYAQRMNSTLPKTCRQVYFDLKETPIFYRVNTFVFENWTPLVTFLAALSPERREEIRSLLIIQQPLFWSSHDDMGFYILSRHHNNSRARAALARQEDQAKNHALSMLSLCTSLRDLELKIAPLGQNDPLAFPLDILAQSWVDLERRLRGQAQDASNLSFLWSLPNIRPTISGAMSSQEPETHAIDFMNPSFPEATNPAVKAWFKDLRPTLKSLIKQNKTLHSQGTGILNEVTPAMVREAIEASGLDFPGEVRISQEIFGSNFGAVSRRTRQKCKNKNAVNQLGIIEAPVPNKYDKNGFLVWEGYVMKVSWKGSAMECGFRGRPFGSTTKHTPSIEPLHAVFGAEGGEKMLYQFYEQLSNSWRYGVLYGEPDNIIDQLRESMQTTPSPKEVVAALQGFLAEWGDTRPVEQDEEGRPSRTRVRHHSLEDLEDFFQECKTMFRRFLAEKETKDKPKATNSKAKK